jgi:excisionase family DNA binding protein
MRRSSPPGAGLPRLLTRQQVAEILGCSLDTVDRRITQGKLLAVRDGRLVRIPVEDLNAYIRRSKRWR